MRRLSPLAALIAIVFSLSCSSSSTTSNAPTGPSGSSCSGGLSLTHGCIRAIAYPPDGTVLVQGTRYVFTIGKTDTTGFTVEGMMVVRDDGAFGAVACGGGNGNGTLGGSMTPEPGSVLFQPRHTYRLYLVAISIEPEEFDRLTRPCVFDARPIDEIPDRMLIATYNYPTS